MKTTSPLIWLGIAVLGLVLFAGYWMFGMDSDMSDMSTMSSPSAASTGERQPLYWVAPMDANYRRSEPGLSPMGMPLIPVYEAGDTITVSAAIQQNLGVRTESTLREDFAPVIEAVGYTGWDQSGIEMLHTRADGWLEVFNLVSVGDDVHTGDILYELFAPNLVSVQREYLTARESGNRQLTAIARDRLFALGFTVAQVDELDRTGVVLNRLAVKAERDATITHIGVRKGNYVQPDTTLATLASLDSVWIETEVFESRASWIEPGLPVTVSFSAFPGESWATDIAYIYPSLEATTRSLRLRVIVANEDRRLRPNMFANVQIESKPRVGVLTVSREAVIRSGAGERVILALGEGMFRPQVVQSGVASGTRIEIRSGLTEGDLVVSSGQFLLDSEANGEQAFARLDASLVPVSMPVMSMPSNQSAADADEPRHSTTGEITQINGTTSVTIAHLPVATLGWPAMTMAFQVPAQLDINAFSVGDQVAFEFVITPQGGYQLTGISQQDSTR